MFTLVFVGWTLLLLEWHFKQYVVLRQHYLRSRWGAARAPGRRRTRHDLSPRHVCCAERPACARVRGLLPTGVALTLPPPRPPARRARARSNGVNYWRRLHMAQADGEGVHDHARFADIVGNVKMDSLLEVCVVGWRGWEGGVLEREAPRLQHARCQLLRAPSFFTARPC